MMSDRSSGEKIREGEEEGRYDVIKMGVRQATKSSVTSKLIRQASVDNLPVSPPPSAVNNYTSVITHRKMRLVLAAAVVVVLVGLTTLVVGVVNTNMASGERRDLLVVMDTMKDNNDNSVMEIESIRSQISELLSQLVIFQNEDDELVHKLQTISDQFSKSENEQISKVLQKITDFEKKTSQNFHKIKQTLTNMKLEIDQFSNSSQEVVQCFKVVIDSVTWFQADQRCHELGAYLAEILDLETMEFVKQYVIPKGGIFWLGATDSAVEGEWVWQTSKQNMEIKDWSKYEPTGGRQDCLSMHSDGMLDDSCSTDRSYICYVIRKGQCPTYSWIKKTSAGSA